MNLEVLSVEPAEAREPDAHMLFAELGRIGADVEGITRSAYDVSETAAHAFIATVAQSQGLAASHDLAGNLVITLPGRAAGPPIYVGSHLDSVPRGGNFDGAAGVIAGLLALIRFKTSGTTPPRTIKVIALRGEESPWFNMACIGSQALFGELGNEMHRKHRLTGRSLEQHLESVGADVPAIAAGRRLLMAADVAAFYELHIEQGPVMIERDAPVGIVSGVRGILRLPEIQCLGEEGHSGAVPRELRRDAAAGAVELLHRMDGHWRGMLDKGHDLVLTSGVIATDPGQHSATRIPSKVTFSLDVRSLEASTLVRVREILQQEMDATERERNVTFSVGSEYLTAPATMDAALRDHLCRTATRCKVPAIEIASGSGHDAMVFARNGVPSAMIFVRNQNGSHNPREAMEMQDFMLGVELLYQALAHEC